VVSGRVQGVWFRESTRRTAEELGLSGWVRNCRDGTVEVEFEGRAEQVRTALEFVREGPPMAQVTGVEVLEETSIPQATHREFRMR
jgi:acylphosphatase